MVSNNGDTINAKSEQMFVFSVCGRTYIVDLVKFKRV